MPWPKGKKYSAEHIAKRSASIVASGEKRKKPVVLDGDLDDYIKAYLLGAQEQQQQA